MLIANYMNARFALFPFEDICLGLFHHHLWIRQQHEYQTELLKALLVTCLLSSESVLIFFLYFISTSFIHLMSYHLMHFFPPFPSLLFGMSFYLPMSLGWFLLGRFLNLPVFFTVRILRKKTTAVLLSIFLFFWRQFEVVFLSVCFTRLH